LIDAKGINKVQGKPFLVSEIEAWLAAGAPDRMTWQTIRGDYKK